jgi:hypothetical protein
MSWISIPERNLDHVQYLSLDGLYRMASIDLEIVLRHHHEMDLVDVEW